MHFQYRFKLPVPVEQAWPVLLDVRRVAPCMPGAAIESGEGDNYVGRMKVKLGPIEMAYKGDLRFIERDDASRRLKIEGVGKEVRGGGGAKALVTIDVVPDGTGCAVSIDSVYTLSGRAAQFGTGMIDEIGAKLMAEFVRRLERLILSGGESGVPSSAAGPAPAGPVPVAAAAPSALSVERTRHDRAWEEPEDEALDLVGLAWRPVVSRALPVLHLLISAATLVYVLIRL